MPIPEPKALLGGIIISIGTDRTSSSRGETSSVEGTFGIGAGRVIVPWAGRDERTRAGVPDVSGIVTKGSTASAAAATGAYGPITEPMLKGAKLRRYDPKFQKAFVVEVKGLPGREAFLSNDFRGAAAKDVRRR